MPHATIPRKWVDAVQVVSQLTLQTRFETSTYKVTCAYLDDGQTEYAGTVTRTQVAAIPFESTEEIARARGAAGRLLVDEVVTHAHVEDCAAWTRSNRIPRTKAVVQMGGAH